MATSYAVEAEKILLGGLLKNNSLFPAVQNIVEADDFLDRQNRLIYVEMQRFFGKRWRVQPKELSVPILAKTTDNLAYLEDLMHLAEGASLDILDYAYIVVQCALNRECPF